MSRLLYPVIHLRDKRFEVPISWGVFLVLLSLLSGWEVASLLFDDPDSTVRGLVSVAFLLVFLASLMIHESGHFFAARSSYWFSRRLTFHLTGSVPTSYYLPPTPWSEIRYSVAGPLISLATGAVMLALANGVRGLPAVSAILELAGWLNILIAAVNLIPSMPLDGGRILRAIFWYLHDSHVSGTRALFIYSQLAATFALAFGLFILAWQPNLMIVGFWLVGLGWLAIRTARTELMHSTLIERASKVRASDAVMGLNPTIRARASLTEAVDILLEQRDNGPGLVRDRDRFVGMITLEEISQTPRIEWASITVSEVMVPLDTLPDTPPDAPLLDVLREQFRHAPDPIIVRGGNGDVIGLIRHDMAPRLLLRRAEERGIELRRQRSPEE